MGEFNVNKSTGDLIDTAGMPETYSADQVMMSDGVTNVESALTYSETEHVVGTWIDGKPVYQKTFVNTTPGSGTRDVEMGIVQNVDIGWVESGFYINDNQNFAVSGASLDVHATGRNANSTTYDSYAAFATGAVADASIKGKVFVVFGSTTASSAIYVTVRYTKTTD